jgi:hypothetical protein
LPAYPGRKEETILRRIADVPGGSYLEKPLALIDAWRSQETHSIHSALLRFSAQSRRTAKN